MKKKQTSDDLARIRKDGKIHAPRWKFWTTYRNMRKRCEDPTSAHYKDYWWRWIKCLRKSYEDFKTDMYPSYLEHVEKYWEKDTTIERVDVNWDYCKENCTRATRLEQKRNTRRNHRRHWKWEELTLQEIYNKENINIAYKTFARRVYNKGWSIEKAITTPFIDQLHKYDWRWWQYILREIYDMENPPVCYGTFMSRIYQSWWSMEDAVYTPARQKPLSINNNI